MPASFRDYFLTYPEVFVTTYRTQAVRVYPLAVYERDVEGNLDTRGGLDPEAERTQLLFSANGDQTMVDGQGRITFKEKLRERTSLHPGTEVIVIGTETPRNRMPAL